MPSQSPRRCLPRLLQVQREDALDLEHGDRVVVDLRVSASTSGSTMTHVITITPKTMAGKFMSPLIRMGLPKQTQDAMDSLKKMLEPA